MFKKAVLRHLTVWALVLGGVAGLLSAGPALAQGHPSKPFRMADDLGVTAVDSPGGAYIEQVAPDSLAEGLGLLPNDLITAVDGMVVDAEHGFDTRLSASGIVSGLTLSVERQGQALTMRLTQDAIDGISSAAPATRATQPDQPTIGQSLSGQMGTHHPAWMSDMLSSLRDFFGSLKADVKAGVPSAN